MITNWDKLVNRIKAEARYRVGNDNGNKQARAVAVKIVLLVDCEGTPLSYIISGARMESPNSETWNKAREMLELF